MTERKMSHPKAAQIEMDGYDQLTTEFDERSEEAPGIHLKPVPDEVASPVVSHHHIEAVRLVDTRQQKEEIAETLLLKLCDYLNNQSLEKEEVIKLTEHCLEIVEKRECRTAIEENIDVTELNENKPAGAADSLVKFILPNEKDTEKRDSQTALKGDMDDTDVNRFADKFVTHVLETTVSNLENDKKQDFLTAENQDTDIADLHSRQISGLVENFVKHPLQNIYSTHRQDYKDAVHGHVDASDQISGFAEDNFDKCPLGNVADEQRAIQRDINDQGLINNQILKSAENVLQSVLENIVKSQKQNYQAVIERDETVIDLNKDQMTLSADSLNDFAPKNVVSTHIQDYQDAVRQNTDIKDLNEDQISSLTENLVKFALQNVNNAQEEDYHTAVTQDVDIEDMNQLQISGFVDNLVKSALENVENDQAQDYRAAVQGDKDASDLNLRQISSFSENLVKFALENVLIAQRKDYCQVSELAENVVKYALENAEKAQQGNYETAVKEHTDITELNENQISDFADNLVQFAIKNVASAQNQDYTNALNKDVDTIDLNKRQLTGFTDSLVQTSIENVVVSERQVHRSAVKHGADISDLNKKQVCGLVDNLVKFAVQNLENPPTQDYQAALSETTNIADLNKNQISGFADNLVKFVFNNVEKVLNQDYQTTVREDLGIGDLNKNQISGFADKFVDFVLRNAESGQKKDYQTAFEGDAEVEDLNKDQLSGFANSFVEFMLRNTVNTKNKDYQTVVNEHVDTDDLNKRQLSDLADELMKFALDSANIIRKMDYKTAVQKDVNITDLNDYQISNIAENLVNFTLTKVMKTQKQDYQTAVKDDVDTADLNIDQISDFAEHLVRFVLQKQNMAQKADYQTSVRGDVDSTVNGLADNLVQFTLDKLLNDIKKIDMSHEDLTKVTISIIGNHETAENEKVVNKEIENFVENTLKEIVEERRTDIETPVNDDVLDDFIIKTLYSLADDIEHGRLSKYMIKDMLNLMTAELESTGTQTTPQTNFKDILQTIITELESENNESLYRLVHVFVSSYLSFQTSSHESMEELVNFIIQRIGTEIKGDVSDINSLTKVSSVLSANSLTIAQMSNIASDIIAVRDKSLCEIANIIVDDVIERAKEEVMNADTNELNQIAIQLTSSINNIQHSESKIAEDTVLPTLREITRDIDVGRLSSSTILSMASSVVSLYSSGVSKNDTLNTTMQIVLCRLRGEGFTLDEANYLLGTIIRKYQCEQDVSCTSTESKSANTELAELLVRETVTKLYYGIGSGQISKKDFAEEGKQKRLSTETPQDVVNLVTSIIKHLKNEIPNCIDNSEVIRFLKVVDAENSDVICTVNEIVQSFDRIQDEITVNGHSSQYLKRILHHFVSHRGTDREIFSIGTVLQTMDVGILSNFVKCTVADILGDIRKNRIRSSEMLMDDTSHPTDTGALIQTASSLVANKLVYNLMCRIEKNVNDGMIDTTEFHKKLVNNDCQTEPLLVKVESDVLGRISSSELGARILETLNNIVSNMRLDKIVDRIKCNDTFDCTKRRVSSIIVEDFVLETLQDIIENMQDKLNYNAMQDDDKLKQDTSDTSVYVVNIMNNVLKDMTAEIKNEELKIHGSLSEQCRSSVSLEAEAVVVGVLYNAVNEFVGKGDMKMLKHSSATSGEKSHNHKVIYKLQSMQRDIQDKDNIAVKKNVADIIQSSVDYNEADADDKFINTTISKIIETLQNNKLKANESSIQRMSPYFVESGSTVELISIPSKEDNESMLIDGRHLSLQKMAEMTTRMIQMYDENVQSLSGSDQDIVGEIPKEKVIELLVEPVSKTITNIEHGNLSETETHELATALAVKYPVESFEEFETTCHDSKVNGPVEDFVVKTLNRVNEELHGGQMHHDKLRTLVKSMTTIHQELASSSHLPDVVPASREMIREPVKSVLRNIVISFSNDDLLLSDDSKSQLTKPTSSLSRKDPNVNPNASAKALYSRSQDCMCLSVKTTHVPAIQSFCNATDGGTKAVISDNMLIDKRASMRNNSVKTQKPTCMVSPQQISRDSMKNEKIQYVYNGTQPSKTGKNEVTSRAHHLSGVSQKILKRCNQLTNSTRTLSKPTLDSLERCSPKPVNGSGSKSSARPVIDNRARYTCKENTVNRSFRKISTPNTTKNANSNLPKIPHINLPTQSRQVNPPTPSRQTHQSKACSQKRCDIRSISVQMTFSDKGLNQPVCDKRSSSTMDSYNNMTKKTPIKVILPKRSNQLTRRKSVQPERLTDRPRMTKEILAGIEQNHSAEQRKSLEIHSLCGSHKTKLSVRPYTTVPHRQSPFH